MLHTNAKKIQESTYIERNVRIINRKITIVGEWTKSRKYIT